MEDEEDEASEEADPLRRQMMDAFRKQAEQREFYHEIPVLDDLRATWDGALWIVRIGEDLDDSSPIDVFGPNREYVGTFAEETPGCRPLSGLTVSSPTGNSTSWMCRRSW